MNSLIQVEVIIFKNTGKYYTTEHVDVNKNQLKHDAFESVMETLKNQYSNGFHIVTTDEFFGCPFMGTLK